MGKPQIKYTNKPGQSWNSVLQDNNIVATNSNNHFVASYVDGVLEELYDRTDYLNIKYESVIPSVMHRITHNFNTYDLQVDILVQDPESLRWSKDLVSIEFVSDRIIEIYLTEASNIKAVVKTIFASS
jgi:hypothetical protein